MNIKRIFAIVYSYFILVYLELVLMMFTTGSIETSFLYTMLFAVPEAALLYVTSSLFKPIVNKIIFNVIIFLTGIYFSIQLVYYNVFQGFMSVSLLKMGGEAAVNFGDQILTGIADSVWGLIAVFLILLATPIFTCIKLITFDRYEIKLSVMNICAVVLAHFACLSIITIGGTGPYTVYDVYHSRFTSTDNSVQNLGMLVTTRLEIQQQLFGKINISGSKADRYSITNTKSYSNNEYNVLDIDFNEILKNCDSADAAELTTLISERTPTKKNKYTGIFEGYNLITICAESFSPYLIDEERTPTLYKLANEGFIFNNFYNSYESVTTNGEYSFCMGMFPDLSRTVEDNSFIASIENDLPFTLANQFVGIGADTYAYHNFLGTYYSRCYTHTNMGYEVFKAPDSGLDIAPTWPSSDYDMMVQSVDDYIDSGKQFHAYYMTFSGHYQYNWANIMCARNKSLVKDLDYPLGVKAYIAANMELEKALTYLLERLENAGIAEKTVIVLTADHYPYGLTELEYNYLAGKDVDTDFDKYRNSFICWTAGISEPVVVDDICSTIDILPTLLNLFGFEYDSRLVVGRDILSDCDKIAILSNQSFITDRYRFNAQKNKIILTSATDVDKKEIEESKNYVINVLRISRDILNTNYYQYITEEGK